MWCRPSMLRGESTTRVGWSRYVNREEADVYRTVRRGNAADALMCGTKGRDRAAP
jgi:hypothetical protein